MHDIIDVIKNIQSLSENNTAFNIIKDFEHVLDELDIYVFKNWREGELCMGPDVERYSVKCSFMWPKEEMPDPQGAKRLYENGCKVVYKREHIMIPRKIKNPNDYRPGTKKGKIDAHPVWVVDITMPKSLMQNIHIGQENKKNNQMAELMKYSSADTTDTTEVAQQGDQPND
jgi:hypothetical protein